MTAATPDTLAFVADRLEAAERTLYSTAPVRDLLPAGDVEAAYRVQTIGIERRVRAGQVRSGRKVGLTSVAVQRQFRVDEPDYGVLFEHMETEDGAELNVDELIHPKIEAEIAFILCRDILVADAASIRSAVGGVRASLEIVDCRITDYDITIVDTIADNAAVAGYVLGSAELGIDDLDLPAVQMQLLRGGEMVSAGTGADSLGDPLRALAWLAQAALDRGDPLRSGEVVLSGSLGPIVTLEPNTRYEAHFTGLGSVGVHTRSGARA